MKHELKQKITYNDLSDGLKWAIFGGWTFLILFVGAFLWGFFFG